MHFSAVSRARIVSSCILSNHTHGQSPEVNHSTPLRKCAYNLSSMPDRDVFGAYAAQNRGDDDPRVMLDYA